VYEYGEPIEVTFSYSEAKKRDFVGIYDNSDPDKIPKRSELELRTCNSQSCKKKVPSGILIFGPDDPDESKKQNWPLAAGVYRAYLMDKLKNIIAYSDFSVTEAATESPTTLFPCADSSDKFVQKLKSNGKAKLKLCSWLTENNIDKTCKKNVDYYVEGSETYKPAQVTCAFTCGSCDPCYENSKSKFYSSTRNGKAKTKKCKSLKKDEDIKRYCEKTESEFGYPPAGVVCPVTCSGITGVCV